MEKIADVMLGVLFGPARKFGEWLGELGIEKPGLFWVAIGLGCWTVFLAAAPWVYVIAQETAAGLPPPSGERLEGLLIWSTMCGSFPLVAWFAFPAWLVLWSRTRRPRLETDGVGPVECPGCRRMVTAGATRCGACGALVVPGAAPLSAPGPTEQSPVLAPKRFADFSPTPEQFDDFARMLRQTKEKSGTLICLECGHDNPVGQTQCDECGAWVPQTAKARWAHGRRTQES